MKAALYARVSTDDKGQNPETQLFKLRSFAAARGYEITREYVDFGSGANCDRPQFQKMMDDSRRKKHDLILVVKIDRMMRSLVNMMNTLESLDHYGVALECVDQPIDTKTAMGRLFIQITGAFAEWEREITRERIKDGIARAKHQGIKCGRPLLPDNAVSPEALRMREYRKRKRFEARLQTSGVGGDISTPPETGQKEGGGL